MTTHIPITLGLDAKGEVIELNAALRASTHMHVIGGSGKGKSKFLESLIRQDIRAGHGLCLLDWHGELYNNIVRWCAEENIGLFGDPRKIVVLNVSHPEHVLPFNPFAKKSDDTSSRAADLVSLVLRAWNLTNANEMPTFRRTCTALFRFMLDEQETLPNAAHLLEFSNRKTLLEYAVRASGEDMRAADFWNRLANVKNAAEWDGQMLSTTNKLAPLLEYSAPRRFMGLNVEGFDVARAMDEGAIVLVNLVQSESLPEDVARVFAAFLLAEFLRAARMRGDRKSRNGIEPPQFILYLDEFQQYITDDMAASLDEVRKGGLHIVLAHQHMAHFADHPKLKESVLVNARLRAVFGGLSTHSACELAEEMCLAELNERQIKKALYHTIHLYREETRVINSSSEAESEMEADTESSGEGSAEGLASISGAGSVDMHAVMMPPGVGSEGWYETDSSGASSFASEATSYATSEFSMSGHTRGTGRTSQRGQTVVPVWVPTPVQELAQEQDWTLEEKRLKLAQMLKHQTPRHCFINLDQPGGTQPLCVPEVNTPYVSPAMLDDYEKRLCEMQGSLPAAEVDRRLLESSREFTQRVVARPRPALITHRGARDDDEEDFE
jgi:hypothetical protein